MLGELAFTDYAFWYSIMLKVMLISLGQPLIMTTAEAEEHVMTWGREVDKIKWATSMGFPNSTLCATCMGVYKY